MLWAAVPAAALTSTPDDPLFPQQWNLRQIRAPQAWAVSTGAGVRIGVVDTGVDLDHQDLAGKIVAAANCIGSNGNPSQCTTGNGAGQDDNGHGTFVAGEAAADTNNGIGIAGVAPGAQLVVAKALDSSGSGNFSDINAGIEWVVDHGARVVNLSLGSSTPIVDGTLGMDSLSPGIEYAWSHGAVPVLAAGNTNYFGLGSSNYGNADAIVVGATGRNGQVAPYSSPTGNAKWAVLAPGGNGYSGGQPDCSTSADEPDCIISTYWVQGKNNVYGYDEGTSMAAPEVAGAVALLLAMGRTPQQAVDTILSTANHSVSCGSGSPNCAGLLDIAAAVGAGSGARAEPPPPPSSAGAPTVPQSAAARSAPAAGGVLAPGTTASTPESAPGARTATRRRGPPGTLADALPVAPGTPRRAKTSAAPGAVALGALASSAAGGFVLWRRIRRAGGWRLRPAAGGSARTASRSGP